MNKKKIGIIIGIMVVLCGLIIGFGDNISQIFNKTSSDERVYVEQISSINQQFIGSVSRYNGIVETQDLIEINVDSSRKIDKIHVKVGDTVEIGQLLFTYDTNDLKLQLEQIHLEKESIKNDIASNEEQIKLLTEQMNAVVEAEKFEYSTQIKNIENDISQKNYDLQSKQLEIEKIEKQINQSSINSETNGVVKSINERGIDELGNSVALISILHSEDYRVKGSIDEQNIWNIAEGQNVILRSRVDETKTWNGTISKIDTDNTDQNSDNTNDDGVMMASKYSFYIDLESSEGLILGQHLYIELDEGQNTVKDGIWLYSSYVVQNENSAYVWAANKNNRLEKRIVELGEYDAEVDQYQILSGLTEDDYIAWPMDGLYEGVTTVTNIEEENWNYESDETMDEDIYDYTETESVEGTE